MVTDEFKTRIDPLSFYVRVSELLCLKSEVNTRLGQDIRMINIVMTSFRLGLNMMSSTLSLSMVIFTYTTLRPVHVSI